MRFMALPVPPVAGGFIDGLDERDAPAPFARVAGRRAVGPDRGEEVLDHALVARRVRDERGTRVLLVDQRARSCPSLRCAAGNRESAAVDASNTPNAPLVELEQRGRRVFDVDLVEPRRRRGRVTRATGPHIQSSVSSV